MSLATLPLPGAAEDGADAPRMRMSPSIAKILLARSPMHAWDAHRLGGNAPDEPTEAQARGRILDAMVFGGAEKLSIIDAADYRTKAAQAARDAAVAEGRIPVLAHKLAAYDAATSAWLAQLEDMGIRLIGESQVPLLWEDGGVPCKGILDHLILGPDGATFLDLKTCDDCGPEAVARAMVNLGHDVQHAAYLDAVEAAYPHLAGRVRGFFLYCEVDRPHAVNVVEPAGTMRALGRFKWRKAVATWGECLRTGRFPGYPDVTRVEAKPWQLDAAMGEETDG